MPITADRIARLRGFGLSEYAARAYLALLDLGVTEARDVAALSKVPPSKVYGILDHLHEKGLVTILAEFPRKYAPVPFGDFLQRIHDEHQQAAEEIRRERAALTAAFAIVGGAAGSDRGAVTLLRGRRNVVARMDEIADSATSDLLLVLSRGQAAAPEGWTAAAARARERGVRVRVVGPGVKGNGRRPARLPDAAFAVAVDDRAALVGNAVPDDGQPGEGSDVAIAVDLDGIAAVLCALLDMRLEAPDGGSSATPRRRTSIVGLDEVGLHTGLVL